MKSLKNIANVVVLFATTHCSDSGRVREDTVAVVVAVVAVVAAVAAAAAAAAVAAVVVLVLHFNHKGVLFCLILPGCLLNIDLSLNCCYNILEGLLTFVVVNM